jgi:hypothetical protein
MISVAFIQSAGGLLIGAYMILGFVYRVQLHYDHLLYSYLLRQYINAREYRLR